MVEFESEIEVSDGFGSCFSDERKNIGKTVTPRKVWHHQCEINRLK